MPILYKWRVVEVPEPDIWRQKGKELGWAMTEEDVPGYEQATGRKLEKVPGSAYEPPPGRMVSTGMFYENLPDKD